MNLSNNVAEWNSKQFSIVEYISSGGYGDVYKGFDNINKIPVALKAFQVGGSYKLAYRELCVLQHVSSHYLLELKSAYVLLESGKITKLWLALTLMDYDLFSILHKKDLIFSFEANIKITYQLLKGLQYLHDAGIIHRDLKPSNIGVNRNYDLRLLDFGLARDCEGKQTQNVQTINYRAVEVFCNQPYTSAIDMWSAGCIFAELFTKKVLFKAPKVFDQVREIVKITGIPKDVTYTELEVFRSKVPKVSQVRDVIINDIKTFVCHADQPYGNAEGAENVVNLICSMLELNPEKRPKPLHAMNSPLYQQYYELVKQYPSDKEVVPFHCDIDGLSDEQLQDKIIEEVGKFKTK